MNTYCCQVTASTVLPATFMNLWGRQRTKILQFEVNHIPRLKQNKLRHRSGHSLGSCAFGEGPQAQTWPIHSDWKLNCTECEGNYAFSFLHFLHHLELKTQKHILPMSVFLSPCLVAPKSFSLWSKLICPISCSLRTLRPTRKQTR